MRLNPGDVIKSIHTGDAFVVEHVSADGHCFILQPRGKENSRSYNMHDFNRSFVRVSESDTLQAGNSTAIPDCSFSGLFNSARAFLDVLYEFGADEVAISEYVTNLEDALRVAAAPQQEVK